jgi:hypothetical protein
LKKNILNFSLRAASLEFQPPQVMLWCALWCCDVVMLWCCDVVLPSCWKLCQLEAVNCEPVWRDWLLAGACFTALHFAVIFSMRLCSLQGNSAQQPVSPHQLPTVQTKLVCMVTWDEAGADFF